jgi:hypothetical protein
MRHWHAEINPQYAMLRGSAVYAVMTVPGFSEDRLSKPASGRRL